MNGNENGELLRPVKIDSFKIVSATFLFYSLNNIGFVSFLVLSLHWPELMRHWQSVESLPIFQNFVHKTAYVRRIRLVSSTVLLMALGISIGVSFLFRILT